MQPGDKVGRYKLGEQIGEGAMAEVFASSHPVFERTLAIKVLKKEACWDKSFIARFLDDARAAHTLDHPNIVRVLDVDDTGEQPFIVMELIDGAALDVWLEGRQLEAAEAARIGRDVASALAAAHAAGMVHRDVKPSNVLIDRATGVAKLTDFGAAKRERPGAQKLTEMGQRIGTPRYMAPEQVEGKSVDPRTDLFALGATLYELLAGRPAFEGDNLAAVYHAILFGEPRPLAELRPDAPPELVQLVERMLARDPDARPDSAAEVAAALAPFAGVPAGANGTVNPSATVTPAAAGATPPPGRTVTPSAATGTAGAPPPPQPAAGGPERGGGDRARDPNRTPPMANTTKRRPIPLMPLAGLAAVLLVAVGLIAWWLWPSEPEPVAVVPAEPETAALEPAPVEPEPEAATPAPLPATAAPEATAPETAAPETAAPEPVSPAPEAEPVAPPEEEAEPAPTPPETEAMETAALPASPTAPEAEPEEPAPPAAEPEAETAMLPPATEAVPGAPAPVTLDCPPDPAAAPGCTLAAQALSVLEAPAAPPPIVTLNRPDGVYLDQDHFVAEVELPDEFGGYLYLDLITDNGTVIHLLPEPLREDNALPAGGEIRVGVEERERREGVRHWQVSGPFGEGYLLATVSENRLYEGLRPIEEPIDDYREVLLDALLDPATGAKTAGVERIEFRPRG